MSSVMKQFLDNSYLFGGNAPFIEELYEKYLVNPGSVPDEWREYFDRMQVLPGSSTKDVAHAPVVESFVQRAKKGELGGRVTRAGKPAYYGEKIAVKTLDDKLSASGTFALTASGGSSGIFFKYPSVTRSGSDCGAFSLS